MSSSAPIPLSSELSAAWTRATTDPKPPRYFQIGIVNDTFALLHEDPGTVSVSKDFDSMSAKVGPEGCYFIFRAAGPKNWILVSYVPDTLKVAQRMVYAASKPTLQSKLGSQFINDNKHVSNVSEFTYAHMLMKGPAPVTASAPAKSTQSYNPSNADALSEFEIMREKALKEEEEERQSRMRVRAGSPHDAKDKPSGIGGYHQVKIPLSDSVTEALQSFQGGSVDMVRFKIMGKGTSFEADLTVPAGDGLGATRENIFPSEPRFYLLRHNGQAVFVYCCPDAAPPSTRMVYSTSKPTFAKDIEDFGITIGRKMEVRGAEDLADDAVRGGAARSYAPSYASSSSSSSSSEPSGSFGLRSTGLRDGLVEGRKATSPPASPSGPPRGIGAGVMAGKKSVGAQVLPRGPGSYGAPQVTGAHPVYGLMEKGSHVHAAPTVSAGAGVKKKIVMPPPGAW
eukprot:TRINITY_DN4767_c0_g1_i3.p1 TRINITY_DN4767_c0_g1~~TRINITY_DN4767_c0_g1_i3.p1  ORF type:complete len:479 (-),score=96.66 TRINITY_DN4767_c0_g1_i3:44-1402(-)